VVSDFLRGPWVNVMVHVMTQADVPEAESQSLINVVEDLVTSLQRPTTLEERDHLRGMLPSLTERLRKGMAIIEWPPKLRGDLMEQLMVVHARYLRSPPAPAEAPRELTPQEIVSQIRTEHIDSVWEQLNPDPEPRIHVDALPTVPMGLTAQGEGQAGPEAIMPLKRGRDGKLGVTGGGGTTINMVVHANDANSVRASMGQIKADLARAVSSARRNL